MKKSQNMIIPRSQLKLQIYLSFYFLVVLFITIVPSDAEETIRVGYFEKKPVIYSENNDVPKGLAVDILSDIANENNWKLEYIYGSFSESLNNLKSGKTDLMVPVGYSVSREKDIDYSDTSVLQSWGCLFSREDKAIHSLQNVEGKHIAFIKDSIFYTEFRNLINSFNIDCKFTETAGYNEMFSGIAERNFDGGVGDRLAIIRADESLTENIGGTIVFHPFELHIAAAEGDPKNLLPVISNYLKEGRAESDSRYYKYLNYWLSGISEKESSLPLVLTVVISFILALALIYMISRIRFIRRIFGLTEIVDVSVSNNVLIISWLICVLYWTGDVFFEYLLVNPDNVKFTTMILSFYDLREIFMRLVIVIIIIAGGIIISRIFAKLTISQTQAKQIAEDLRITLNSIGDAVIATDIFGKVTQMNPVAEELTGWSINDAKGEKLTQIFKIYNAKTGEDAGNPVEKVIKSGKTVGLTHHTKLVSKGGKEYQIADSAAGIIDPQGELNGVVLVFRDVSKEYKMQERIIANEKRFRSYFEQSRIGIAITSVDNKWIEVNNYLCSMLGYSSEELYKMTFAELIYPEDSGIDDVQFNRLKNGEIINYDVEKRFIHKNGSIIYTILSINLQHNTDTDSDDYLLTLVHDITEHEKISEELQKISKLKSVGTLAGGIAQDFNNILTGVFGYISLAKMSVSENTETFSLLNEAEKSMNRAVKLTKQLLTFSKGGTPVKETLNISEIIHEVVKFDLSGSNVKPVFMKHEDLWNVKADKEQIWQVFSNLTINAEQAMMDSGHLYISDDEVICTLLSGMIKAIGFSSETVSDGREAIEKYKESLENETPFDVVIMDLTIPGGMGGKEAVKQILKINPDAKVIVSSGYSVDPVMSEYKNYGFKGVITKPYTMDNLKRVINNVLI